MIFHKTNDMKRSEIEVKIKFENYDRRWSLLIIDRSVPGTHETYNVVFNSGCVGISYRRKGIAQSEAQRIIGEYKSNK